MTIKLADVTPSQIQMTMWRMALRHADGVRARRSGGPRDRAAHLSYQRAYEASRSRYGVRLRGGKTVYYETRAKASRVRIGVRVIEAFCPSSYPLEVVDLLAAGVSAASILADAGYVARLLSLSRRAA